MDRYYKWFLVGFVLIFSVSMVFAQEQEKPRKSPNAMVYQKVGNVDVTVTYCRPGVKGRTIWGGLVPYDKVWRTGANEATTIEFSGDVKLDGHEVPAGKYALFTIPGKTEWTVILNKVAKQWGAFKYDQTQDLLRFKVTPHMLDDFHERLVFGFINEAKNKSALVMAWEKVKISFEVEDFKADLSDKELRPSPATKVSQRIGLTDITVSYGSPGVKGRKIWGKLVPYGLAPGNKYSNEKPFPWRVGANEATTIEFSKDVKVNGNAVPAGKYSLFAIPGESEWTLILNKTADQWGAYKYDQSQDLLRFKVQPKPADFHERLMFMFSNLEDKSGTVNIVWEKLKVPFKIETL